MSTCGKTLKKLRTLSLKILMRLLCHGRGHLTPVEAISLPPEEVAHPLLVEEGVSPASVVAASLGPFERITSEFPEEKVMPLLSKQQWPPVAMQENADFP